MTTEQDPFAGRLRRLRQRTGLTLRQLAAVSGYSTTTLSTAETGQRPVTWPVAEAFIQACGEDPHEWRPLWALAHATAAPAGSPALGFEPVADGADPRRCGCDGDKLTVTSRYVQWTEHLWGGYRNVQLGTVELRYSPRQHAAWARFVGSDALDNIAGRRRIDLSIEVHRCDDGASQTFLSRYCLDWHWSDVLLTNGATLHARARVYRNDNQLGAADTDQAKLR
jgi:transcriptional regulator with XRE-family HTH domain